MSAPRAEAVPLRVDGAVAAATLALGIGLALADGAAGVPTGGAEVAGAGSLGTLAAGAVAEGADADVDAAGTGAAVGELRVASTR